jgi:hypothetical protein
VTLSRSRVATLSQNPLIFLIRKGSLRNRSPFGSRIAVRLAHTRPQPGAAGSGRRAGGIRKDRGCGATASTTQLLSQGSQARVSAQPLSLAGILAEARADERKTFGRTGHECLASKLTTRRKHCGRHAPAVTRGMRVPAGHTE